MQKQYRAHNSLMPFYLSWLTQPDNSNYNLCFSYQLHTKNEALFLVDKLQHLVNLRPYLRQTFHLEGDALIATIHENLSAKIRFLTTSKDQLRDLETKLLKYEHDISRESSIHLSIISFDDDNSCILFFNIHHIVMDGITLDTFITELNQLLKDEPLAQLTEDSYKNQVLAEPVIEILAEDQDIKDYIYQIDEASKEMSLGVDSSKDNVHYTELLSQEMIENLSIFSKAHSISIFNLLLLAQCVFFCKLFNQESFLSHYPINIRNKKNVDGCFINFIPFLLKLEDKATFLSLVKSHKERMSFFKKISKSDFNALSLKSTSSFASSNLAKPLSLIFMNQEYSSKNYIQLADSSFSIKYRHTNNKMIFSFDLKDGILPEYLADNLLSRFFCYLKKLIDSPLIPLAATALVFEEEKQKLLYHYNNTAAFYPSEKTIHQLFIEQVEKTPDNVAIVYDDEYMTYAQLDERTNQLANYFISKCQMKPKNLIALCLESSAELIISMISILKTGCAYVTLDSTLLKDRIIYILQDTHAQTIITNLKNLERLNDLSPTMDKSLQIIAIDAPNIAAEMIDFSSSFLHIKNDVHDLSHIIYTSGTTGAPKGVMVTHKNVLSLTQSPNHINISELDTFALFSDINFDASTFEIWTPLLNGARLFIPTDKLTILSDTKYLKEFLNNQHITVLWLTKTLFDQLYQLDESIFNHLNYLLVGGEALNKFLIYKLAKSPHKPLHLINGYGPTENTTFSCTYLITAEAIKDLETVPIGTPLSNRTAYILDSHLNLLPIGAIGELYVGGDGLALGYLNKDNLTKEKFVLNPFSAKNPNASYLYKTGDLVRMLPDGNIEYLGRNDFQVKIRGYRVELPEIENKLMEHPDIKQTIVIENKFFEPHSEKQYLIAYYVSEKELDLTHYLVESLPEYMLPKLYIHLYEFPQTSSGKLNRKLLPNPTLFLSRSTEYIAPQNPEQKLICEAFAQILHVEKIGISDDFFLHGGNSIKAIALTSILQSSFKITVSDIFTKKTPEKMANDLVSSQNDLNMQLDRVKTLFQEVNADKNQNSRGLNINTERYLESFKNHHFNVSNKKIKNILLSGATGYLGCNILYQLLKETDYKIFLLVRGSSDERASLRINQKFHFYFNEQLQDMSEGRVIIFRADIEKPYLGLDTDKYELLVRDTDSIVHSAALTRHYGEYDKFYSANVQATINLLELALLTKTKDFHHISTISVLHNSIDNKQFYTEQDYVTELDPQSTFYIKTKHEAECEVLKYRARGINSNIYRIGNLAFILKNYRTQENIEDNAFYNRIKCLIVLRAMSKEISMEEISPVDYTARAIIKILEKKELENETYHVLNPNPCNIANFFSEFEQIAMQILSIDNFIDLLKERISLPNIHNNLIIRFMLHHGWLDGEHKNQFNSMVMQDKTNYMLKKLDFEWPEITKQIFFEFIEKNYFY